MTNHPEIINLITQEYPFLIAHEYPFLKNSTLGIEKQFYSESSRQYHTYLVKSNYPRFEKFVAKGTLNPKYTLENEWQVLKQLNKASFPCPKLLLPEHQPQDFLLLKFIEGIKASEKLLKNEDIAQVFAQIGNLTGWLHTIKAKGYGDLTKTEKVDWANYSQTNITKRLNGARKIISEDLFVQSSELIKSLHDLLIEESRLPPVLIHRDIYCDNFIVENETNQYYLIDYGMAIGGRPFYDLAKFYIFDLYRFPDQVNSFLQGYNQHINLPENFEELLKLYLVRELLGCINFFHSIKKQNYLELMIQILGELVNETGTITKLITDSGKFA